MLKSRTIFDILKSVFDKKDQEYNAILTCSVVLWGTEVGGWRRLNRDWSLLELRGIKISFFTCNFNN